LIKVALLAVWSIFSASLWAGDAKLDAEKTYLLGMRIAQGQSGVNPQAEKAFHLLQKSAGQGYVPAVYALAWAYYTGLGVQRDLPQAVDHFLHAAKRENANSQYMLAILYGRGEGVSQNSQTSVYWLKKAALNGHVEAAHWWNRLNVGQPMAQ